MCIKSHTLAAEVGGQYHLVPPEIPQNRISKCSSSPNSKVPTCPPNPTSAATDSHQKPVTPSTVKAKDNKTHLDQFDMIHALFFSKIKSIYRSTLHNIIIPPIICVSR